MTPATPLPIPCPLRDGEESTLLLDYCAQRLDPRRAAEVEAHLAACPGCAAFHRAQSAAWSALDSWEQAPVSSGFHRRLSARIAAEPRGFSRIPAWFRTVSLKPALPLALAAAAFLLYVNVPAPLPALPQSAQVVEQAESALEDLDMLDQLKLRVE